MKPEILVKDFAQALDQFVEALQVKPDHDVVRAGCIQYFEFTFELAWKAVKSAAEADGVDAGGSPRASLRAAFAQGWIDDEAIWLEMLDARNRMSHTYDAKNALNIYERLPYFVQAMRALLQHLNLVG
ncbi:MAG: HI0074 family nucleotidyltransferase substrate-binding subunit [Comamonadaceae bacterium]